MDEFEETGFKTLHLLLQPPHLLPSILFQVIGLDACALHKMKRIGRVADLEPRKVFVCAGYVLCGSVRVRGGDWPRREGSGDRKGHSHCWRIPD